MLCPNCGTKTTTEHKFCRNCGMNLEPVSRALAEHLSVGGAAAGRVAREPERRAPRPPMGGLFAALSVVVFGVLLTAFVPGRPFKFLGVAAALIGLVTTLVFFLTPPRPARDAEPPPPSLDPAAPNTGRPLREQTFDRVPASVTDHTTELLGVEIKDRKPRE